MSQETQQWIYEKFLSGMEATHGEPWWKDRDTCNPANHYEGPIPIEAVEKLFGYDVNLAKVWVEDKDGNMFLAEEFIACVPDNAQKCFGIHSKNFSVKGHQLRQWLIEGPAKVINGKVGISNAGLLKDGAQAWVNISTPEEWKTPQGVDFRPQLLWTTAFDGSIASTVKETDVISLCDNTRAAALNSKGLSYKVKHTKNSFFKLEDAKAALHLLEQNAEGFAAEIAALCELKVTNAQYDAFIAKLVPLPEIKDKDINKRDYSTRNATIAAQRREKLNGMYRADGRVAPWQGTAFGVLQLVNTFNTHESPMRNEGRIHRAHRNMENVITGKLQNQDRDAFELLAKICDWQLNRELVAA